MMKRQKADRTNLIKYYFSFFILLFIAGCSSIPFKETDYVSLDQEDPLTVVERYKKNIPDDFQLMNTVILKYFRKKLSCLGFIEVDTREKSYSVACLSPIGLKLFELTGSSEGVKSYFVPFEFKGKDVFTNSIGEDIKRIYFDLIPSSRAKIKRKKFKFVFRDNLGPGVIKYEFAGPDGHLVEKSYYEDNRLKWRVSYYEYKGGNGRIYPWGIIFKNYSYGYSLTFKLKEILN